MNTLIRTEEDASTAALAGLSLPPIPRATPEEIERRRALYAKTIALREEIGPIGIDVADLIRLGRDDEDGSLYEADGSLLAEGAIESSRHAEGLAAHAAELETGRDDRHNHR